jgi:transcriptional regulator with XRE-family HTH domain
MVSLGKEIKKARIDKGWNQKDVQARTGISQKHLSAIECDSVDPRWSMMKRLAAVLDLDLAQLAREDTHAEQPTAQRQRTRKTTPVA